MPELTVTSPYVDSRVDSNTCTMGNPMPDSTLTLQYARVDFIPRSRLKILPQKKSEACTINYTDDKDSPAKKISGINLPSLQKRTVYICRGAEGEWRKTQKLRKKVSYGKGSLFITHMHCFLCI